MNRKHIIFLTVLLVLVSLSGCFPGPNTMVDVPVMDQTVAGFFMGLWHGIIAPFTFIVSLFTEKISMYEVHNSGGWYDFGFVLGAGILFGGGGKASKRRR